MPTISNGQTLDITLGQSVSGILVLGGGTLLVHSGGSVSGTTLDAQADAVVYGGGADDATVIDGGLEDVYGSSSNAMVDAGAQVVYGTTTNTALTGSGIQQVFTGGTASGTVVGSAGGGQGNSGPVQVVGFGGTSVGTIVNAGGVQDVQSTGIAHDTTINSGGYESVGNGGTAVGATIQSGGNLDVYDGTLSGSVIDNGTLTFWTGNTFSGQLSGTGSVVVGDGVLLLNSTNNFAGNIAINGETLELGATGAAGSATIEFTGHAGTLQIDGTSMPCNAILGFESGDLIDLAGIGLDPAGTALLAAGNVLQITEAGHLYQLQLDPNASYAGTSFSLYADAASGTYITLDQQPISDTLTVSSGQSVNDILVLDGGSLHVLSGGTASATMIDAGASDLIDAGGTVTGTIITGVAGSTSGGSETVYGSASGTTVLNGGFQDVWGTAANTDVSGEFSFQQIKLGGSAVGTTLDGGGSVDGSYQSIIAGGVASSTIVNQGGNQIVEAGGVADGTDVMSGGLEQVYAGGTTDNTTIDGGTLALGAGASAGGTITFVGTGGTLYVGDANADGAVIESFSQGNLIVFDGAFNSHSSVQLLTGNVLQVVANSVTYDLQLDPNADFSGQTFKIASDGPSGTEVYLVATPVPTSDPPAPTVADIVFNAGQTSVAASTLFTASDPDGDTIATYAFEDTGSGHFVLNGVAQVNNQEIDVTAAQLSQLTYQSAPGAEDAVQIRVSDGNAWSNWASFTVTAPPLVIESFGSTSLVQLGDNYYLDSIGGGTGPELTSGGVSVVAGQSGNWTPIAAEQTASGYEVAWHDTFTGNYEVWNTDSSGNTTATVSGSLALESLEPSFHQDLNGDGVIGVVSTTIATDGSTSLIQVGNNFYLDDVNSGTGPSLKLEGEEYVAGDPSDSWTPVGAVQTANGYDIALKWGNTYSISTADSNGNFTSFAQTQLLGSSLALEQWETTFNQDLNGDGTVGVVSTTIHTNGSTSLVEACGSLYFDVAGSAVASGPSLKYGGFDFSVDQTNWVPIGAVATATGYQIAWELPGGGQFMVWNTDSNGNYVSNAFSASNIWANVSGTSAALESIETSFQQDLNGDGTIGILGTIEGFGATKLMQVGNDYFLNPVAGGSGPELMYGGAPWAAGQAWAPIGVEKTSTGYEVALLNASTHLYTIWNTDSSGNVLSASISGASGTNAALESIETSFQQDLNGDGVIGVPSGPPPSSTTIEAFGATALVQSGNDYFLNPVAGGTGPELTYGGTPWAAGQAWAPIGVEKTSSGYEVALFNASSHLYTIWNTDSSGNVLSASLSGASGTNTALESIETSFQQDLNGDHIIGVPSGPPENSTTIESLGVTALVQTGNDYVFNPVAGGTGPELTYGGAPWAAGQAWAPIGVEKTSSGYEVALLNASTHLYTVWNADSSGNVLGSSLSNASGTSAALESAEVSFQQDLNGDGVIGVPSGPPPSSTTIEAFGVTALVQTGNDYFFNPVAGGSGPELTYGGTPWAAGQAWTPIGVEQTSSGYEVALFNASSQLYTVWNTDSSGNVLSASISGVSGTNTALESIETNFQQDLNGDNLIGPPSPASPAASVAPITAPASGNAILAGTAANDTFVFNAHFGNDTVTSFQPGADQVDLDHTLFASVADLLAHTADNAAGSAVVTVGANQSITFDHVSTQVLQQHASDFHLV